MNCLVTGAAGFIGSTLCERLLALGHKVVGIDSFLDYYSPFIKRENISKIIKDKNFKFIKGDLNNLNLEVILSETDYIFHLAAQPGVRASWGKNFDIYIESNIRATQRILEHCKELESLKKFIFASSSSIYGDTDNFPITEENSKVPLSPYGATKLLGEDLCNIYWKNYQIPIISLRFFTVYGPRQRPDMAFHRFIKAFQENKEILIYGNGSQSRDFTYIDDIVEANILAMESNVLGEAINIGGGDRISLIETVEILEEIWGKKIPIKYLQKQRGDMPHTFADISKAKSLLKYQPKTSLKEGLKKEVDWFLNNLDVLTK